MSGRILLLFLFMLPLVYGSRCKRGFGLWQGNMLCGDFDAMNGSSWWYARSCDYFYDNDYCRSEIENSSLSYVASYWNFYQSPTYTCHNAVNKSAVIGPWKPNRIDKGNLTPAQLAARWQIFQTFTTLDYALISPTIAPCGNKCVQGLTPAEYLDQFLTNCNGNCRIDYLNTFTEWCNATKTMEYFKMLYDSYGIPICATNLICRSPTNSASDVLAFMDDILPQLDAAYYIGCYAWANARIKHDWGSIKTSASLFYPNNSTLTAQGVKYNQ